MAVVVVTAAGMVEATVAVTSDIRRGANATAFDISREDSYAKATTEDLDVLYRRIIERDNPVVHNMRKLALMENWSLSRTLAAMLYILVIEREGRVEEMRRAMDFSTGPIRMSVPANVVIPDTWEKKTK